MLKITLSVSIILHYFKDLFQEAIIEVVHHFFNYNILGEVNNVTKL